MSDDGGARALGLPPGVPEEVVGQDEEKYGTTNPVVAALIDRWLGVVRTAIGPEPRLVVDVGLGEGFATERTVPPGVPVVGIEYRVGKVLSATQRLRNVRGVVGDAGLLPLRSRSAPTVTCIEVLEHVTEPAAAVQELGRITAGRCVVSVPWEPIFRMGNLARGKNVSRLGNNPEHVQQFTPRTLRRLLETQFGHVTVRTCLPWIVATARP